jgi:predicted PurR-regulated permease PerM
MIEPDSTSPIPVWKNWQVALATFFVVLVILSFWLIFRFRLVFFILFIAVVISTAITPAVDWLQKRGLPRSMGVILIYLLILAAVIGFVFLVAPLVIDQTAEMLQVVPDYYQSLREWLVDSPSLLIRRIGLQLPRQLDLLPVDGAESPIPSPVPGEETQEQDQDLLEQIAVLLDYLGIFARGIFTSVAVFLLAFYWTLDGERTIRALLLILPQKHREGARETISAVQMRVGGYIRGVGLLSLIVGGLALVAYWIIGLPYALSLALIAGIMEVVPIIGPGLGAFPAVLVAISLGEPTTVMMVLAAVVMIQLLENTVLGPRIMDKSVGVNPMVTLLALVTFTSILGIPGALLAVPIAAVIQLVIERFLITPALEEKPAEGRDNLSALRLEVQELSSDVRKQVRKKDGKIPGDSDQSDLYEDTIEEITGELDRLLAQERQRRALERGEGL